MWAEGGGSELREWGQLVRNVPMPNSCLAEAHDYGATLQSQLIGSFQSLKVRQLLKKEAVTLHNYLISLLLDVLYHFKTLMMMLIPIRNGAGSTVKMQVREGRFLMGRKRRITSSASACPRALRRIIRLVGDQS